MRRKGKIDREHLQDLLDVAIADSGLTHVELARQSGISDRQLRRLLTGDSSVGTIPTVLRALDWEIEEVVHYRAPGA